MEIDNLRAAFGYSRDNSDIEPALAWCRPLQALWFTRGRIREGRAWFDAAVSDLDERRTEVAAAVHARALADKAVLDAWVGDIDSLAQAEQALGIARDLGEPALLARALTACGFCAGQGSNAAAAWEYFTEAIGLARELDDRWRLSQILAWQTLAAGVAGDPAALRAAGQEGRDLADSIGDGFHSRQCRDWLGYALDHAGRFGRSRRTIERGNGRGRGGSRRNLSGEQPRGSDHGIAFQGKVAAARAAAEATLDGGRGAGREILRYSGTLVLGFAALAAGDGAAAHEAREAGCQHASAVGSMVAIQRVWNIASALADGDVAAARSCADEAVSTVSGWYLVWALTDARARGNRGGGQPNRPSMMPARRSRSPPRSRSHLGIPDILECLAVVAGEDGASTKLPVSSPRQTPSDTDGCDAIQNL